ncbi:uncharacterized protein [Arachis hypogaea]|uniref:Uncharacterized protein n=1 Tax=Arachis hypogaea TaxID=3818 RepID=A0A444YIS7_ARAHY|nr:uncharacterized protein LOC112756459 isoform X1 [Arachis hypogaea]RYR01787.1 hypothetical protein Ahy_B06g080653 [Arachis hypogaea]
MWALRCLPLRNRVLRASYSKSISATWVEDDFGTSKRVLTRDEDFKSNFRLPVSDLSPSHMNRALRASCFKFYRSWHASLNFTMTRRQFSGSTTDQDESSDDESDKMDKGVEEGKIPVYIPWKSAALFKMSNSDKRKGKQKMTSNNKIKKVKLTRLAESLEPITSNSTTTPSATTANTLSSLHASSNVETSQRKLKLDLAGEGFLPSLTAAHAISDIIKGHYSQPWPSWKKIPDATRKFWWEKFKSKHQFFPPDLYWARKNFERRGVALLKNLLGKARASRVKPQWIEDGVWDALCAYWNTDTGFLQKSTQGKSNRASGCSGFGAALHTAGPISVTQHKTNMKISLKRIPTQLELFAKTHKHKDETWVDKKSKHVANAIEEAIQKVSEEGSNAPNKMDVWYEIARFKKGRIHVLVIKFNKKGSRMLEHEEVMKRMQEWLQMLEHEEIMKRMQEQSRMQEENTDLKTRLEKTERRLELINKLNLKFRFLN